MAVAAAAVLAFAAASCSSDADSGPSQPSQPSLSDEDDRPVRISAQVSQEVLTRANGYYQESGAVTRGEYYLTYESKDSSNSVATVDFDSAEAADTGVGIATAPTGDALTWKQIAAKSNVTFCLDNVLPESDTKADDPDTPQTTVTFGTGDGENPFVAAPFDREKGTNDLLWGEKNVTVNTKKIEFDLHHCMSRVKVQVTADKTYATDDEELDLSKATVEITQLVLTPESFNRLDGTLALGESPQYETLTLVKEGEGWVLPEGSDVETPEGPDAESGTENIEMRTTIDYVLPPQNLREDSERPRLVIKLENGDTFSGILPHVMEVDGSYAKPYPVALAFLREHVLTLRTVISADPPQLSFMPVTVVEWVDKGSFELDGHQAGIYSAADFVDLITQYNAGKKFQIARYGYVAKPDEGEYAGQEIWIFNFWNHVSLTSAQIKKMTNPSEKDFIFSTNGFTISVDGQPVTAERLKQMVTGN